MKKIPRDENNHQDISEIEASLSDDLWQRIPRIYRDTVCGRKHIHAFRDNGDYFCKRLYCDNYGHRPCSDAARNSTLNIAEARFGEGEFVYYRFFEGDPSKIKEQVGNARTNARKKGVEAETLHVEVTNLVRDVTLPRKPGLHVWASTALGAREGPLWQEMNQGEGLTTVRFEMSLPGVVEARFSYGWLHKEKPRTEGKWRTLKAGEEVTRRIHEVIDQLGVIKSGSGLVLSGEGEGFGHLPDGVTPKQAYNLARHIKESWDLSTSP